MPSAQSVSFIRTKHLEPMRILILLLLAGTALHAIDLPPLPEAVTSFGAVVLDGRLYAYGGHKAGSHEWSRDTTSGSLHRLDLDKPARWETLAGGPAVQSPGLAASAGKIYLIGGMQPQNKEGADPLLKSLTHAKVFDTASGKWSDLPALPEPRSSHDIAVLGDKLFVVGGWPLDTSKSTAAADDRHAPRPFHKTMLVLDLAKPEAGWRNLPQPFERRAIALVAVKGKLFVLGGMNAKNETVADAACYDPAANTWTKLPDLPSSGKLKGFATAACELDGRLIASPSGGKVYALSDDGTKWDEAGQLRQSRYFHQLEGWSAQRVIALGGTKGGDPLDNVEVLQVAPVVKVSAAK